MTNLSNPDCPYFPCHEGADSENFNCLFCYCPLYVLGEKCGGSFTYTPAGIKDCSACLLPHGPGGYDYVLSRCGDVIDLVRKKETP
ncbi:MAG: cysteine-rich small domain-containing protein [Oscillibacter sp.]|nr:cysteine-rich small domain-containing protein [Oscillibacter sp.]